MVLNKCSFSCNFIIYMQQDHHIHGGPKALNPYKSLAKTGEGFKNKFKDQKVLKKSLLICHKYKISLKLFF